MIDKKYSMSSYLALRYTERPDVDFSEKLKYRHPILPADENRILVKTAQDISEAIESQLLKIRGVQKDWYPSFWGDGFCNSSLIFTGM